MLGAEPVWEDITMKRPHYLRWARYGVDTLNQRIASSQTCQYFHKLHLLIVKYYATAMHRL
jgi:hypothetical protein